MARATFPRQARLLRPRQFRRVFARGRKHASPAFIVIVAPRSHGCARLGLALAKRHIRRASDRNRIKRVLRESFRGVRWQLGSVDIVVLGRRHTATCDNAELFEQLDCIWVRVAQAEAARGSPGV